MKNFPYEWVLFDLDDTLFDFQKSQSFVLDQLFRNHGLDAFPQALPVYLELNHRLWAAYQSGEIGIEGVKVERFRQLLEYFQLPGSAKVMEEEFRHLLGQSPYLMEGARDLLDQLQAHSRLAVVTNGIQETQILRLQAAGLSHYFDHLFISSQMGVQKPDPLYFDLVKEKIGVGDPAKVLLVGDNPVADIQGGSQAGFHTLWLNSRQVERPQDLQTTYVASSLGQVADLLSLPA